jgi:hypothetical protein
MLRGLGAILLAAPVSTYVYFAMMDVVLGTKGTAKDFAHVWFFQLLFVTPFVLGAFLVLGVPVYLIGRNVGWFATLPASLVTSGIIGSILGALAWLPEEKPIKIFHGSIAGLAAGAVVGTIVWWMVAGAAATAAGRGGISA